MPFTAPSGSHSPASGRVSVRGSCLEALLGACGAADVRRGARPAGERTDPAERLTRAPQCPARHPRTGPARAALSHRRPVSHGSTQVPHVHTATGKRSSTKLGTSGPKGHLHCKTQKPPFPWFRFPWSQFPGHGGPRTLKGEPRD